MPEPHVHAELIKAWADGAVIGVENSKDNWTRLTFNDPSWYVGKKYRVDPTCDYALAKIAWLGGDDMVELYLYWLDGGRVELQNSLDNWVPIASSDSYEDPFNYFCGYLDYADSKLRKKKRMVKQVLWVTRFSKIPKFIDSDKAIDYGELQEVFDEDGNSITREVKADD